VVFQGDEQTYLDFTQDARADAGASVAERNPVQVGLSGEHGYPHAGALDFLDNRIDPATGTITARAVLDNADRALTPGLFARVKLLGNDEFRAVLIDDKAVLTDQDRKYVYVLGPENRALRRDVILGRMVDGLRVVSSGLEAGETVLVHGVQKVFFPGMPVAPQVIAMGDGPAVVQGPALQ
jgi:multidrug efflux system membrane fusion protein